VSEGFKNLKNMKSKKSKQKFKPLSEATPEEMQEAFLMGGLWASSELEGYTETGCNE